MTRKRQTWRVRLGETVREIIFPHLHARGFKRTADAPQGFSGFQRLRADGGYDLVEIQFDKWARPLFFINLGVAPPEGVTLPKQEWVEPADVRMYHLSVQARFRRPFDLSPLARWLRPESACHDLARDAIARFADAEEWFSDPANPPSSINVHNYAEIIAQMQKRLD